MERTWDRAVTDDRLGHMCRISLPRPIATAMAAKGFNRVLVKLTDEGILLQPYAAETSRRGNDGKEVVDLPETWA